MSTPLYQKCPLCDGTRKTVAPLMVDGLPIHGSGTGTYSGPINAGSVCPCTRGKTPGFAAVGLTLGQVERAIEDRDRLKQLVLSLADRVADQSELLTARAGRKERA